MLSISPQATASCPYITLPTSFAKLVGRHHQFVILLAAYIRVACHKAYYALLNARKIVICLRNTDDNAVQAHRMDSHCRRRRNEAARRGNGKRHADRVSSAEHERYRWLFHSGNYLGYAEPGLNVAADGV